MSPDSRQVDRITSFRMRGPKTSEMTTRTSCPTHEILSSVHYASNTRMTQLFLSDFRKWRLRARTTGGLVNRHGTTHQRQPRMGYNTIEHGARPPEEQQSPIAEQSEPDQPRSFGVPPQRHHRSTQSTPSIFLLMVLAITLSKYLVQAAHQFQMLNTILKQSNSGLYCELATLFFIHLNVLATLFFIQLNV